MIDRNYPKDSSGKDDLLYNLGISGDTTIGVRKRFKAEAEPRMREGVENVVIFSVGGNDAAYYKESGEFATPLEKFAENYRSFMNEAKAMGGKILITSLTPIVDEWAGEASGKPRIKANDFQKPYDDIIRSIATEYNAVFIDFKNLFADRDLKELINADGIHPNAEGHSLMFDEIEAIVEALLAT